MSTKRKIVTRKPHSEAGAALNFTALVDAIQQVHEQSAAVVNRVVNTTLTLRNWVIGGYIHYYELNGQDRAKYGDELLTRLAERLGKKGHRRMDERELRRYRAFYLTYPLIRESLSPEFTFALPLLPAIRETVSPELRESPKKSYIFEFLGLRAKDAMAETDLEAELVDNLREFLLELGHGFCLEAQQKSIVIGNTRGFVDLVFYHRILKCHVLVELKVDVFRHEHLGQLNTYVTWYRKHMMAPGDNLPVGLLLCAGKDHALVQYATASLDNRLFVSKYAVELPSKDELEKFLHARHLEMGGKMNRGR